MTTTFRTRHACALAAAALVLAPGSTAPALADHEPVGPVGQSGFAPPDPSPAPTVSGTPQDGQTLTANRGGWQMGVTLSHRWIRCNADGATGCVFIHADNSSTYVLSSADVGKTIKLRVRGENNLPAGSREADSSPTGVVDALPPSIQSYPSNTGRAVVGRTLTATSATFGPATPPFTEDQYQWERCEPPDFTTCSEIPGAVFLKHILVEADLGSRLRMRERATYGPDNEIVDAYSPTSETVVEEEESRKKDAGSPRLLAPFPVVAVGGVLTSEGARLSLLRVEGPLGALVRVRCIGRGCSARAVRRRIGAKLKVRIRPLERRMPVGTRLVFRITKPGLIGKYTRLRIRAGKRPVRIDRCLQPGASRPSPCPR